MFLMKLPMMKQILKNQKAKFSAILTEIAVFLRIVSTLQYVKKSNLALGNICEINVRNIYEYKHY